MGSLITLAIYGAMAAAALFAVHAAWSNFTGKYVAEGAAAQMKADMVVVDNLKLDRAQWKTQAESRQAETQACVDKAGKQSAAVDDLNKRYNDAINARKALEAAAKRDNAGKEQRIAELQTAAAARPQLMKCEDELAKARPILQDALCAKRPQDPVCLSRAGAKTLGVPAPK